jgi:hypothetical protein
VNRAALEAEGSGFDDRLVAPVEAAQTDLFEEWLRLCAYTDYGDPQPARLSKLGQLSEQPGQRLLRADRFAGDDEVAAINAVAEKGAPIRGEDTAGPGGA